MSKKTAISLALLTMMLWGSLFPMVKLGFSAYGVESTADILLFAGIRFVICGAVIIAFAAIRDRRCYCPAGASILPILAVGFFAIVLHYALTYTGLEITDSSKTALIKQVGALFYICFSFLFIKSDRPTLQKIVAALIGFLGVVALNVTADGISFSLGDLLILGASFCSVIANVISKRLFARVSPIAVTGISQFFGGVLLLAVGLSMGGGVRFSFNTSLWIMAYICTASIVSYCIWYGIVKTGELSKLLIIKFAEPVFACIFGAIILHENILRWQYLLAFLLISGGIVISNLKRKGSLQTKKQ